MALRPVCSCPLTVRANAKEFQLMADLLESVFAGDLGFPCVRKAFRDFDYFTALAANKVVMVPVITAADHFETGRAVPKIEALHHVHGFKEFQRSIHGCQIAGTI